MTGEPIISAETLAEIEKVSAEWPDGIHSCAWLQEHEPGRRPCTCGRCGRPGTREELEAAIWQLMEQHRARVINAWSFVSAVLDLADAYASGDDEKLTALRREVLHRESRPL